MRVCKYLLKYKQRPKARRLVSDLLEVLAELDDRVEGGGRRDGVGVVGDEKRLGGLVGDDALLALWVWCQCMLG